MLNKFIIIGIIITIGLMTGLYFSNLTLNNSSSVTFVYTVFLIILSISLIGFIYINKQIKSGNRQFVNAFMLVSTLRMLVCAAIIIAAVLKTGANGKFFAIFYLAQYIGLLFTETILLAKEARKK